jgi:ABC-type branched-subunit amino acid transport system substrate-binding protein
VGNPRPTESARGLFALFDWMTGRLPWRLDSRPYPVIVLEPADDPDDPDAEDAPGRHLDELKRFAAEAGLPAVSPDLPEGSEGGEDEEAARGAETAAIALVDAISQPLTWTHTRSPYGRLRFPRSDLVRTIQAAAAEPGPDGSPAPPPYQRSAVAAVDRWNEHARLFRWQSGRLRAPGWWTTVGGSLVAMIAVLAGGIAEQTPSPVLLTASGCLAAVLLIVAGLSTRRIWLAVLSTVGFGGRYRWFARTSFFAVLGDGEDGGDDLGFEGRLHRVYERLAKPDAARFLLQIKTFALLEDLRDQHRRSAPDLRGFKRPCPPVVFLAGAGRHNGGLAVLSAISDIRARRSEFHPLIVIASVDAATREELGGPAPGSGPAPGGDAQERYERWRSSLGTAQGPSESVPLPYLLRIPVTGDPAAGRPDEFTVRRRPRWTWLWSRRSLGAALMALVLVLVYVQTNLRSTYCSVGLPVHWNGDTRIQTNGDGSRECVGVSTHGVRFERGPDSIGLDGERRRPSHRNTGSRLTLADLQRRIEDENEAVLASRKPYVTLVYVGIFTASPGQSDLTVSSIRELAGAHLAQMRNNRSGQPGAVGNPLKVRLLPANTGQNMLFSAETADRILDIAHRDPTLVGVTGFGRNTDHSRAAIERLIAAGLPLVNTVNSSDRLPALPHYYGLAATNFDEAAATRAAVRAELRGKPISRLMLVHRAPGPSRDAYSREIADDVARALTPRTVDRVVYTDTDDIADKVKRNCETAPAPFVYFAGRSEDLPGLMNGLVQGGCTRRHLVLMAGDDVTKTRFGTGPHEVPIPANTVVYHTAFVHLPFLIAGNADQTNGFFLLARNLLGIGGPRARPAEPLLVDGQMALTYDAVVALGQAAQNAFAGLGLTAAASAPVEGSRSVTSGAVLLELRHLYVRNAATGDIDFRGDRHELNGPGDRGLTMIKVTLKDGTPVTVPICGRLNGGVPAPGLKPCPR